MSKESSRSKLMKYVLPDELNICCDDYCNYYNIDKMMYISALMVKLGHMFSSSTIQFQRHKVNANIFMIVVGPQGSGKTHVMKHLSPSFEHFETKEKEKVKARLIEQAVEEFGDEFEGDLKENKLREIDETVDSIVFELDDATEEYFKVNMAKNHKLGIADKTSLITDEISEVITTGKNNSYSKFKKKSLFGMLTGDVASSYRVGGITRVEKGKSHACLYGTIQDSVIKNTFYNDGKGLVERILFCVCNKQAKATLGMEYQMQDDGKDPDAYIKYEKDANDYLIRLIDKGLDRNYKFDWNEENRELVKTINDTLNKATNGNADEYEKLKENFMRLLLNLCILHDTVEIDRGVIMLALELVLYYAECFQKIQKLTSNDNLEGLLISFLTRKGATTMGDIKQKFSKGLKDEKKKEKEKRLKEIIEKNVASGDIIEGTTARSAKNYCVKGVK